MDHLRLPSLHHGHEMPSRQDIKYAPLIDMCIATTFSDRTQKKFVSNQLKENYICTDGCRANSILVYQVICMCVCVFIKLHITAQSGPVILVILCHSH